ncbi:YscQ/HrcQ family type III secretion apparatus protein [Sodalis endosymbiont of Spalangia cameroni]|uniref:YscQ/HrcQ family type III secretion apparatus protein n=1 Tax=Sodalis praecaptivus TaxID=1239307 RepID=UPI0031F977BA
MLSLAPEEQPLAERLMPGGGTLGATALRLQPWPARAEGVIITLDADGALCDLWLPTAVWQGWCETVLGTADWTAIAEPLMASIVAWGLAPLLTAAELTLSPWTPPRRCSVLGRHLTATFSWCVEQQTFQGVLMALPACVWRRLAAKATPATRIADASFPLKAALSIGGSDLTLKELRQLGPGAGIRLHTAGCPQAGKYALILPGGAVLRITWKGEETMEIDALMQDIAVQLEQDAAQDAPPEGADPAAGDDGVVQPLPPAATLHLDTLPQRVRVDVGQVTLSVGALRQLSAGDVVPVTGRFSPYATLRLQDKILGQGELIRCEGALLVRITRWYLTDAKADQANTG